MIELAAIGDTIECRVTYPRPRILRARLSTAEACAIGNSLLMDETSGWTLSSDVRHYKCTCGHTFQAKQSWDDEPIKHCPQCDAETVKEVRKG